MLSFCKGGLRSDTQEDKNIESVNSITNAVNEEELGFGSQKVIGATLKSKYRLAFLQNTRQYEKN